MSAGGIQMKKILTGTLAAAAIAAAIALSGAGPAAAQVAGARIATHADNAGTLATPVQWRGRRVYPGWRGPGWRRWGYGPGWRYRRGWGWWGPGAVATGVIIGGALAAPRYYYGPPGPAYYGPGPAYDDAVAYCTRRFKSFDPYSMTYLGYDGRRHPCP
jgi:hypothetical protein